MTGVKTNERPGTRATLRSYRASASKVREVLNLIRGQDVTRAREILIGIERDVAQVVGKLLDSAIANAVNNDSIPADELFVAACYADDGATLKRFKARARGRAGAIRKKTAHVTIIVARMEEDQLKVVRSKRDAEESNRRARRVARTRGGVSAKKNVAEKELGQTTAVVPTSTTSTEAFEADSQPIEQDSVEESAVVVDAEKENNPIVIDEAEAVSETSASAAESEKEEK